MNGGEPPIEQVRKLFLELRRNNTSNEIKSKKFPNAVREKLNTANILEKNFHITILNMTVQIAAGNYIDNLVKAQREREPHHYAEKRR